MDEIDRYLRALPPGPARRIAIELEQAIQQLCRFPGMGRLDETQTKLASSKVFRLVSEEYIIFYSVELQHILIIGVIYGKRDVDIIMSRRHS